MWTADECIQSPDAAPRTQAMINAAHGTPTSADAESSSLADERTTARRLAAALDRAIDLDQNELAERLAQQSMPIARRFPMLAERIARLRAGRGEFDQALALIESCRRTPASMRLLRIVCLLHAGRRHEAHADLLQWARKASAPLQARIILAMMEWEAGCSDDATRALQRNLSQLEDPATLAALMLTAAAQGRSKMTAHWGNRLRHACMTHGRSRLFEAMLFAAGQCPVPSRHMPTPEAIAALATELVAAESLLPVLCEAQRLASNRTQARFLASAIECALDDLEDQPSAMADLADLWEIAGEYGAAAAWRDRTAPAGRSTVLASIGVHDTVNGSAAAISRKLERAA